MNNIIKNAEEKILCCINNVMYYLDFSRENPRMHSICAEEVTHYAREAFDIFMLIYPVIPSEVDRFRLFVTLHNFRNRVTDEIMEDITTC